MLSGIIFIIRNDLSWRDAAKEYGPHKTLCNRWKRWSDKGIFARMMVGLAANHGEDKTVMIDATYLKAHRTATNLGAKKGGLGRLITARQGISAGNVPRGRSDEGRYEHQAASNMRQP